MELEKWAICTTASFYYKDQNSFHFSLSYLKLVVPVRFFLTAFLDPGLPRGNVHEGNSGPMRGAIPIQSHNLSRLTTPPGAMTPTLFK